MGASAKPAGQLPVIFLMGPTATGKTDLGAALCEWFPVELISVDAAQVYRGMNIGTAKPDSDFLQRYPHHLIDIRDPDQTYSAADFVSDATALIGEVQARGRIPLLVGGTMFYFHALESGLSPLPPGDAGVRRELVREMQERGVEAMHRSLESVDPRLAARIASRDTQRVQRALEIHRLTGRPPSEFMQAGGGLSGEVIKLALFHPDRTVLHRRIGVRFNRMLEEGLVSEVCALLAGLDNPAAVPAMRTVGYRQVMAMLRGECDESGMVASATAATRQLAKRQLTWLRQQSGVVWMGSADPAMTVSATRNYLVHRGL